MKSKRLTSGKVDLIFLIIAYVVTLAAVLSTYWTNTQDNIEIGSISDKKYVAAATTENVHETEKLRQAAMEAVGPVYVTDNEVMPQILADLEKYFDGIADLRDEYDGETDITQLSAYEALSENTNVKLTLTELKTLSGLSSAEFEDFIDNITNLVTEVLEGGVSDVDEALLSIKERLYLSSVDNSLVGVGYDIITGSLKNNVFVDEEATAAAQAAAAAEVSPILILKNQKIVDENEVITEEAYYALEACGFIRSESYKMNLIPFGGKALVITVIFLGILLYFTNFNRKRILNGNEGLLLFTLYILLILLTFVVSTFNYMFVPILGFLVIVTLLLSTGIALIFIPVVTAVTMLITGGDAGYFLYFIASGHIMVLMVCITQKRGKAIFNGFVASVLSGFVMLGISFMDGTALGVFIFAEAALSVLIAFVYVLIAVGSLYVFEALFGIASDLRLSELVNPDQPLIKRLLLEAPGTYQHSLVVANLAETAAYEIGANPTLARVGAYYHDIGKLKNPQYFTENIKGQSPHDSLDAYTSARIIKLHVEDGLEMGKKYRLPQPILDIIYEHHGTGMIKFFYYKAKNNKKSTREVKEEDFRYPCRRPSSKEAAVIMIADTSEAAVRSMMSNKKDGEVIDLDTIIKGMIDDKVKDGQLTDSGLTIKDIDIIQKVLVDIFTGMYHNRIQYPTDEKKDEAPAASENSDGKADKAQPKQTKGKEGAR